MRDSVRYIPALRFHWLTRFYDGVVSLFLREARFRDMTLDAIGDRVPYRILDMGCGTGSLTVRVKQRFPQADVIGVDVDASILTLSRSKASDLNLEIQFYQCSVEDLSGLSAMKSGHMECIVSSLVFHHLTADQKRDALSEAYRLMEPGGRLILADWGKPKNVLMRLAFLLVQVLDGFANTQDNRNGRIPDLMKNAGFDKVSEFGSMNSLLGTLCIYVGYR